MRVIAGAPIRLGLGVSRLRYFCTAEIQSHVNEPLWSREGVPRKKYFFCFNIELLPKKALTWTEVKFQTRPPFWASVLKILSTITTKGLRLEVRFLLM